MPISKVVKIPDDFPDFLLILNSSTWQVDLENWITREKATERRPLTHHPEGFLSKGDFDQFAGRKI